MTTTAYLAATDRPRATQRPRPTLEQSFRRFIRTPKAAMLLALLALGALAAPTVSLAQVGPGLLAAVSVAGLLDTLLLRLTRGEWQFPGGAILSALFVALILDPFEPWYVVVSAAIIAVNSKYLVRTRWSNVFNPAAIALVGAYLLFGSGQSWWGALPDLPLPFIAVLVAAVVYIARRVNKLPMLVAFLGSYFALFTLASFVIDPARVAEVFRVPNVNMALFFAGFMLTDPPTSPARHRDQITYGIIVAIASAVTFLTLGGVYFLPVGLLVGNAWESWRRVAVGRRQPQRKAVPVAA